MTMIVDDADWVLIRHDLQQIDNWVGDGTTRNFLEHIFDIMSRIEKQPASQGNVGHFTHVLIMKLTEQAPGGAHTVRLQDSIRTLAYGALAEIEGGVKSLDTALIDNLTEFVHDCCERFKGMLQPTDSLRMRSITLAAKLPKPVDPDLVKAREWFAASYDDDAQDVLDGMVDREPVLQAYLAGLRAR